MNQLEDDLREAFSRHCSEIPAAVGEQLRRTDYRPRARRVSPRLTVGALAGAAATTAAVVSVVVLGGAPSAFAGWTASPTAPPGPQSATASTNCQAELAALPAPTSPGGWAAVTTDVRGLYSLTIYQGDSAEATCLTGPAVTIVSSHGAGGGSMSVASTGNDASGSITSSAISNSTSTRVGTAGAGSIDATSVAHLTSASEGPLTLVEGHIASDVTGVTLVRSDGTDVQASTGDGWFLAWWPGSQDATSAEVTTPAGVTTQTLNPAPPAPATGNSGA